MLRIAIASFAFSMKSTKICTLCAYHVRAWIRSFLQNVCAYMCIVFTTASNKSLPPRAEESQRARCFSGRLPTFVPTSVPVYPCLSKWVFLQHMYVYVYTSLHQSHVSPLFPTCLSRAKFAIMDEPGSL